MNTDRQTLTVRIPREQNKRLAEHVEKIGLTKAGLILNLINQELSKGQNEKQPAQSEQAEA